ncbi:MAG: 50S ribosomal protein L33 [Chloroflexota bacterium]|nr:50S ribosomal protein L33 [Chloroflexota bacterium]MCY3638421.1 50S ribosomal protein L33 [Chloroflexota bacterium]MDE2686900.1 50S ribosomal protein L33 [Chloroflexota bacterium]MYC07028.1 50S ribosomal protein L33 [Chloroflexota bacterium]
MARRVGNRIIINLSCVDCRERTYHSTKNRRNDPQRIELKKFCPHPRCRTHKLHREVR